MDNNKVAKWIVTGLILIVLIFLAGTVKPWKVVKSGNVGVLVTMGKYSNNELYPGIHFIIPVIQSVIPVDVQVHAINYKGNNNIGIQNGVINEPAITVLDQRGLPITVELTMQYRLLPNYASEVLQEWGYNWESKMINPIIREVVRDVIGQYPAENVPISRAEISSKIKNTIIEDIKALKITSGESPVKVLGIQLRNVRLPEKIAKKIEQVQEAKQEAEKMKYIEEQAKKDQQIKLIRAETSKKEKILDAEGVAKSNSLISSSITSNLIKWKNLDVQQGMADAFKTNPNVTIFYGMGNSKSLNLWTDMPRKK